MRILRNFLLQTSISLTFLCPSYGALDALPSLSKKLLELKKDNPTPARSQLLFDIPVSYNAQVAKWVAYYQGKGRRWYREWLERSYRYLPYIQKELKNEGLPTDLAYMVMVESGFSFHAESHADAVGPWQFIEATGKRYGLRISWWLDERKDITKSTHAAIRYIQDLYREFGSWYLVAASYNMGEGGLRRRIQKYNSRDFWRLVRLGALPEETSQYVPKILAAMLISKAPSLYGFRDIAQGAPYEYDLIQVPGGTDLNQLADFLEVTRKSLKDLNAELLVAYIPKTISTHPVKVPKGARHLALAYLDLERDRRMIR